MLDAITRPEPHVTDIPELKTKLANARLSAAFVESAYGEKYKELIETLEATRNAWEMQNAELVADYERARSERDAADAELRQAVVEFCQVNDTKHFDEQCGARVTVKLDYEQDEATAWAKTNAPFILVADKKQFEGIAKKQDLDFVTKVSSYSAVIAAELS